MNPSDSADMSVNPANIDPGWAVYSSEGQKVGEVVEVHTDAILIKKGMLVPKKLLIPLNAVTEVADEQVCLGLSKEQVDREEFSPFKA